MGYGVIGYVRVPVPKWLHLLRATVLELRRVPVEVTRLVGSVLESVLVIDPTQVVRRLRTVPIRLTRWLRTLLLWVTTQTSTLTSGMTTTSRTYVNPF